MDPFHTFFFLNKKKQRKSFRIPTGITRVGGLRQQTVKPKAPHENLRSQKEEGHEKSGGSIEAAWRGGYVQDLGVEGVEKKNGREYLKLLYYASESCIWQIFNETFKFGSIFKNPKRLHDPTGGWWWRNHPAVMGVCVAKQATCRDGQSPQGGDGRKHLGVIQVGFRFAKKQTETAASQFTKGVEYKFAMFIWAILISERVCYVIRTELYWLDGFRNPKQPPNMYMKPCK